MAISIKPTAVSGAMAHGMTESSMHKALVKNTEKWVALSFYGTLMKQMREDPFKSKLFDGGEGGQAFSQLYDQELSQRMSRGTAHKLVNSIVKNIERGRASSAYAQQRMAIEAPTGEGDFLQSGERGERGTFQG